MIIGGSDVHVSTKSFISDTDIYIGWQKEMNIMLCYINTHSFLSLVTLIQFKVSHNHISIEPRVATITELQFAH